MVDIFGCSPWLGKVPHRELRKGNTTGLKVPKDLEARVALAPRPRGLAGKGPWSWVL